jgi:ABC-type bacteriocin/lantibiotic exporter with double-glycine peptidase domain
LIAFAVASGEPLAILPGRGESVRVDSATGIARYGGDELSPVAYALYPRGRWAGTPIRAWLGDAIGSARLDFVRAGALAIAMGAGSMVPAILVWQLLSAGERGDTLPSSARFALTLSLVAAALGVLAVAWSIAVLRFEGRLRLSALVRLVQRFNRIDVQFLRGLTPETAARALVAGPHLLDRVIDLPTRQCLDGSIALAGLAVLAWFRWDLAGLAVLLMLPPLLLPLLSAHLKLRTERLHTDTRLAQQRFLSALFLGIAQLRGLGAADRAVRHWQRLKARQREAGRKLEQRKLLASACGRTYSWIAPTLLTAYGIAEARIDAVVLPALFMAAWLLFEAVGRGGARLAAATMAKPLAQDAAILLDGPTDSEDRPTSSTSLEPIDFDHVCYRYPDSAAAVLDSLTLRVEPGAILAIIGPSGCGKSTLLRLLLGFDVPSAGSIVRDSARSGRSGLAAWRAGVGAVLQGERIQVASTIRSQIGGLAPCSLAGIWHAAELAGVADDIRALPMGMQTIVEPDNISTGQEQRILIARQLVGRPRLLVLDEATNAIPEQMQVELLANLRALGLTTILVTHRQSAIARADRVIMLDAGAIIFSGTPEQLAAQPQLRLLETEAMIAE